MNEIGAFDAQTSETVRRTAPQATIEIKIVGCCDGRKKDAKSAFKCKLFFVLQIGEIELHWTEGYSK